MFFCFASFACQFRKNPAGLSCWFYSLAAFLALPDNAQSAPAIKHLAFTLPGRTATAGLTGRRRARFLPISPESYGRERLGVCLVV